MEHRNEIKDIAPTLSKWNQKEGYTIPKDYFDGLSDNILNRANEEGNLEPYFSSLPDQVMDKLKKEESTKVITIRSWYRYGAVAALLIAVGSIIWSYNSDDTHLETYAVSTEAEELEYILDNVTIDEFLNSDIIDDATFEELLVSGEENAIVIESIEDLFYTYDDDELLEEFL